MNIDIAIQVSGEDGEKLQTVSRQFSGSFDENLNWGEGTDKQGRSFDTFLAEFLSSSGKIFRQALLYGSRSACRKRGKDKREDTEVTYMIRFGNGQKVEGRIPIFKSMSKISEKENKKRKSSGKKKIKGLQLNREEPEDFIDYFMQKAVERYESNFVHIGGILNERKEIEG